MNRSLLAPVSACFVLAALSACSVQEPEILTEEPQAIQKQEVTPAYIPGVVTVQFSEDLTRQIEEALADGIPVATKAPQLGGILQDLGIKQLRRVFPYAGEFEERTRREGMHRFYYVEFEEETPVTKAAHEIGTVPGVERVTPRIPMRLRKVDDPYFDSQWHFANTRYKGCDINVQKVWEEFTVGSSNVIVSVVDEGVYMEHEDLVDNLVPAYPDGSGSYNFNNDTPNLAPTQGHGTHVAGVIAAVSNNGKGVAGIAGGDAAAGKPGVKVLSCQIFDLYGLQPDIEQAIKHGADHGAVILQCSWGFSPDLNGDGITTPEEIALYRSYTIDDLPEYKSAIDYFIKYAGCDNKGDQLPDSPMKGGLAIFAAGNDNFDFDPLVSYEPIIAVGAFGLTGAKSSFSNYGEWLDIAAPGGDGKFGIYSTLLGNSYGGSSWQGTSMACPHVSGVAALLASYFGGPGFTAEECRARLERGAVSGFFEGSRYIGRKLDAYGAFTFDINTPILPPVVAWEGTPDTDIHYNEVKEYAVTLSDPNNLRVHLVVPKDQVGVFLTEEGKVAVDGKVLGPGKHTITVQAENEDHAKTDLSLEVNVLYNKRPVMLEGLPQGFVLEGPGKEVNLDLSECFQDPDGDDLKFSASLSQPELADVTYSESGSLTLKANKSGVAQLEVSASDGTLAATASINVVVQHPSMPVFLYPSSAVESISVAIDAKETVPVTLAVYAPTGAKVKEEQAEGSELSPVKLSLDGLAPGIYTLKVSYVGATHTLRFNKR